MFRNQALKAELASLSKQVRSNLSLLKGIEENPLRPACQEPSKIGLAHRKRKPTQIIAVHREHIEGAELDFFVVPAGMQRVEIGDAVYAKDDRLTVDHKLLLPVL